MSEQEWLDIFGDNLRDMLEEAYMSQEELADAIGVTRATVNRYINKQRIPSVKAIINMSMVFGCTIDELIYFEDRII